MRELRRRQKSNESGKASGYCHCEAFTQFSCSEYFYENSPSSPHRTNIHTCHGHAYKSVISSFKSVISSYKSGISSFISGFHRVNCGYHRVGDGISSLRHGVSIIRFWRVIIHIWRVIILFWLSSNMLRLS